MAKHKARKMTKEERKNWEDFHGTGSKPNIFKIRSASDLIMLPFMVVMLLLMSAPLIPFTIGTLFVTVLDKISAPFRR